MNESLESGGKNMSWGSNNSGGCKLEERDHGEACMVSEQWKLAEGEAETRTGRWGRDNDRGGEQREGIMMLTYCKERILVSGSGDMVVLSELNAVL